MEDKTWGMRFNQHGDYQRLLKGQKPEGCPDWLESRQMDIWQEPGLVLWNNLDKRIEVLRGGEALRLLNELFSQEDWKSQGISVTRLVHKVELQPPHRGRGKKAKQDTEIAPRKSETVYEEMVHLPPEAGPELMDLLEKSKPILVEMAASDNEKWKMVVGQFWDFAFESFHKQEHEKLDLTNRPFVWQKEDQYKLVCKYQSVEGRISIGKSKLSWFAHVTRPRHSGKSQYFVELLKAIEWVEKGMVELANEPDVLEPPPYFRTEEQMLAERARLRKKLLGGPFWIDPAALEPKQITYKIFIELDANPVSFKTMELETGSSIRYEEKYLSPSKLLEALNLDIDRFQVDQPFGENTDWCRITSLTVFFQENSATDQAQKAWDQSRILPQFKVKKISRARYGYQEVETGYVTYLGACHEPDKPWSQPIAREEYMEDRAFRETLCFALDIADFRDYLDADPEYSSDEKMLQAMHTIRSRSRVLPEEVRRESKVWLAEHGPLE